MKKILFVLGTRPEVIKLAPLFLYFKAQKSDMQVFLCNTEQQKQLSNQTLQFFNLKADFNLNVMTQDQSLPLLNAKLLNQLDELLSKQKFDALIVQGDTMSAYCGALAAFYKKIPIFHIEAGLRSHNLYEPFPEEAMRLMISKLADLHFCPTKEDYKNLVKEGIAKDKIFITKNTGIDAIYYIDKNELINSSKRLKRLGLNLKQDKIVLVTIHRRENHNNIKALAKCLLKLAYTHAQITFILPLHPNPNVKQVLEETLKNTQNIILCGALNYIDLINVMKHSSLILSDSGGIQEEAPSFKVKVLVLRNFTERTAGLKNGFSELVGNDEELIYKRVNYYLENPFYTKKQNPYGDGKASKRIFSAIANFFKGKNL
ncbi:non-hydrolyzing UDP-N-acetylglucosamine 2-epimerase [Campylobacter sp. MIT 97-5078]|uniref:non-hydrolyzing UDP-N-acetylglucosamine 2-epimerase n=1 Tax=Campylobacter sp. MIT 97-5078 TaxID=1548153 RepID=UPI0006893051|nr:UDP-N-acetylglucosamine 2-epimerase (non-hydrolyzing) [Campylobacter sp. MIT 97-5078]TQR27092.1 UDP-N-acetylglucosamine 2-epimerase (non-hydrolyzing) [Campylobacter sp. MIT 97-5078]